MRGTHYGADYRWFTRFIGDDVVIPKVRVNRDDVDEILAERGVQPTPAPADALDPPTAIDDPRDLRRVTGADEPLRPDGAQTGAEADGGHRPGSLRAALARARARAPGVVEGGADAPRPLATGAKPTLTPEVQRLATLIRESVNPRELARYSFEQLLEAFRAANLNPGAGAKIVQAWGHGRQLSPEQVVAAMRRAKDEWLDHASRAPSPPAPLMMSVDRWDYDSVVADYLNQRNNVGRGPKDIDRERLMLLRRLMASFSGQANYGFTGADAVAEAASGTDILSR